MQVIKERLVIGLLSLGLLGGFSLFIYGTVLSALTAQS